MKEVRAFKCDFCHRCFMRQCDAKRHEDACNGNPKRRACKTCKHCRENSIVDGEDIYGNVLEHKAFWCFYHDKPISDKPYYIDCDVDYYYGQERLIPGTCEHYDQRQEEPQ